MVNFYELAQLMNETGELSLAPAGQQPQQAQPLGNMGGPANTPQPTQPTTAQQQDGQDIDVEADQQLADLPKEMKMLLQELGRRGGDRSLYMDARELLLKLKSKPALLEVLQRIIAVAGNMSRTAYTTAQNRVNAQTGQ